MICLIPHNKKLHLSETKEKIVRNLFWSVVGKIVTLLGSLFVGIIVARYLGPDKYGLMNYVLSVIAIFLVLAQFGFDLVEIREEARKPHLRDYIIGTFFCLRIVFAFITLGLIALYVFVYESDVYVRNLILIYALSVILSVFNVARNHFTALVWNEYVVKTEISRTVIGIIIKIGLLLLEAPLTWFIWALVFDVFLLASGYTLSYRKLIDSPLKWRFKGKIARYALKQSFPLLLSGAAIVIYQRIDQVMLGQMLDKSSVGYYSVAVRFVEVLIFIPTIISQTIGPILVKNYHEDKAIYKRNATIFMNITTWLSILPAALVSFLSFPIVYYTFGAQYLPAVSILAIMSFKVIGVSLSQSSGQLIIVEKKQKWVSIRNVFGCAVCVILNYLVIPRYEGIGAAVVSIITILSSGFIANLLIPSYRQIFKMQISSILLGWKDIVNIKQIMK